MGNCWELSLTSTPVRAWTIPTTRRGPWGPTAHHGDAAVGVADAAPSVPSSADADPTPFTNLVGRTVVCIPGRGPLDAAVSAMAAMLLRRGGCTVLERSRERKYGEAEFGDDRAEFVCVLGLFDQRGAARMQPLLKRLQQKSPETCVLLAVQRAGIEVARPDQSMELAPIPSLAELSLAIGAKQRVAVPRN